MHILFLLPDFPYPPSTGGRSKVFNELLYLSRKHQCDLLCLGSSKNEDVHGLVTVLPNVRLLKTIQGPSTFIKLLGAFWNFIRLLPPSLSAFTTRSFECELTKIIANGQYDVIHYDIINMAQHLKFGCGLASVHSPNDATSLAYLRLAKQVPWSLTRVRLFLSSWLLKRYERKMYPRFSKVHVVSDVDASYLKSINPQIDIDVIPIALDINDKDVSARKERDNNLSKNIICTGNFVNPAISDGAQEFISEVFPAILLKIPTVKLIILGKNADEKLLEKINDNESIEYVEFVDDFQSFLLQADVILAPDHSGAPGAKTRVLQAMGLGLPVVGTSSAFEGIPVIKGEHGLVYDSMSDCVQQMLELLSNSDERLVMGEKGRDLVMNQFSLKAIGPKYEKMYLDAVSKYS